MSFSAPEPYPSTPNLWDFSDEDEPFYVQDCFNLLFFNFSATISKIMHITDALPWRLYRLLAGIS